MNLHKFTSIISGALLLISLNLQAKEVENAYINGIGNTELEAFRSAEKLTEAFTEKYGHILANTEVISIYNESQWGPLDLVESGMQATNLDKFLEGLTGLQILTASKAAEISGKLSFNASEGAYMKLLEINDLLIDNKSLFEPSDPFAMIDIEDSIGDIQNSAIIQPLTGPGSTSQGSENTLNEIHSVNQFARLLDLGMTATELANLNAIAGASEIFRDLALARKEFRENYGYYASQEYQTQQKIRGKLDEVLNAGGSVNIIAHSQGNYFANEAVNNINQPNNTRLLSVGSPLGVIPDTGAFVNLREDMVVRGFNYNLGWNYSNIPDSRWDTLLNGLLPATIAVNEYYIASANNEFNSDSKGHNFITAYLKPDSDSREAIIDTMAKHYIEMGGELINPPDEDSLSYQKDKLQEAMDYWHQIWLENGHKNYYVDDVYVPFSSTGYPLGINDNGYSHKFVDTTILDEEYFLGNYIFKFTHKINGDALYYDVIKGIIEYVTAEEILVNDLNYLQDVKELFALFVQVHIQESYTYQFNEYNIDLYEFQGDIPSFVDISGYYRYSNYEKIMVNNVKSPICTSMAYDMGNGDFMYFGNPECDNAISIDNGYVDCDSIYRSMRDVFYIPAMSLYDTKLTKTTNIGGICKFEYNDYFFQYNPSNGNVSEVE
jgi:hypothetical protein